MAAALNAPQLWFVQDPVGKGIEPLERVVAYHIRADRLRAVAERGDGMQSTE